MVKYYDYYGLIDSSEIIKSFKLIADKYNRFALSFRVQTYCILLAFSIMSQRIFKSHFIVEINSQ